MNSPCQMDPVNAVHEPVEDGIGQGVIADDLIPVVDRHLRGHDGGADAVTMVEPLEQIAALPGGELGQPQSSTIIRSVLAKPAMSLEKRPSPWVRPKSSVVIEPSRSRVRVFRYNKRGVPGSASRWGSPS